VLYPNATADISSCGKYRYLLSRNWSEGPKLGFVMLNPSTADAKMEDPTIRRCIRFARDANFSGVMVANLFAWRATDPSELKDVSDPIGPGNNKALREMLACVQLVVCAWGTKSFGGRDFEVIELIRHAGKVPHCLKTTADGHPSHPLYLPAGLRPMPMMVQSPSM
jgi:hypothetical protein